MDLLGMLALVYVIYEDDPCQKPYLSWYYLNGMMSLISLLYLTWFCEVQLKHNYQTTTALVGCYLLEFGYFLLTCCAWRIISVEEVEDVCKVTQAGPSELLVDLIILDYLRSLKLLALVVFGVLCGPLLLTCWCVQREKAPVDAVKLNTKLSKVTLEQLSQLRQHNYRHQMSDSGSVAAAECLDQSEDDVCCICMDDFAADKSQQLVVLPCKAHFFHEACITEWMRKQNVCPVCRHPVTVEGLNKQEKELEKLLKQIKATKDV